MILIDSLQLVRIHKYFKIL